MIKTFSRLGDRTQLDSQHSQWWLPQDPLPSQAGLLSFILHSLFLRFVGTVRVRPPTTWEAARLPEPCYDTTIRGDGALSTPGAAQNSTFLRDIVQVVEDRILIFDPEEKDRVRSFQERGFMPPGTKRYKDRRFMFDKVFNHESRQQDVYDATAEPLLKGVIEGYNATVFAYGVRPRSFRSISCSVLICYVLGYRLRQDPYHQWYRRGSWTHLPDYGGPLQENRGAQRGTQRRSHGHIPRDL